jgi:hypothetical protein
MSGTVTHRLHPFDRSFQRRAIAQIAKKFFRTGPIVRRVSDSYIIFLGRGPHQNPHDIASIQQAPDHIAP